MHNIDETATNYATASIKERMQITIIIANSLNWPTAWARKTANRASLNMILTTSSELEKTLLSKDTILNAVQSNSWRCDSKFFYV